MAGNSIINVFKDYFWLVAEQIVPLLVPIIVILLVFKIVYDLLLRRN